VSVDERLEGVEPEERLSGEEGEAARKYAIATASVDERLERLHV